MGLEIAINATRDETRVAILENRVLTELYIDRRKDRGIVGNVYKGRVVKVLPGMQAAFVDIGVERAAFLYVADVTFPADRFSPSMETNEEGTDEEISAHVDPDDFPPVNPEDSQTDPMAGNHPGAGPQEASESSVKTAVERDRRKYRGYGHLAIEDLLQEGQEIAVQVTKEPIGTKGPRVTGYVSLPGRSLVYMPTVNHVGVSRRISRDEERARLREIIHRLRRPGSGYIVRTVSEGVDEADLKADMEFLDLVWQKILQKREQNPAPSLLHTDLDLVFRTVRDLFTSRVERLWVDSPQEYTRIREFVEAYLPGLTDRLELYDKEEPLFDHLEIEIEISRALARKVWIKSGGYIVVDHSEALTVIDVNTGRYVGKRHLEDTILKTNLEAVKEIAYQIRLRNIGGIIIIDFIDMEREKNREKVYNALLEAVATDRAKMRISRISELGLIEMSRERTREDLLRALCEPCRYCEARGYTKTPLSVCLEIFREIRKVGSSPRERKLIIGVHPDVANLLYDEERQGIDELEKKFQKKIIIKADSNLHVEQYDIVAL